jgi:hypothetical protein
MGGSRLLNEAFNLTMKLKVAKAAAGTPVRLTMRQVTRVPVGMLLPPAECCSDG